MRIGVLAGGIDTPGLNRVIKTIAHKGIQSHGWEVVGIRDGWQGLRKSRTMPIGLTEVNGVLTKDGTVLGSSAAVPDDSGDAQLLRDLGIDALVVIGADDTLARAARLAAEGVRVVAVPATIHNDVAATDSTFGFDTAVQTVADVIDRCRTTAESHNRAMVVEVMGRDSGWIALHAGLAGGANAIVGPEGEFDLAEVVSLVERRFDQDGAPVVVIADGATPQGEQARHGGVGTWLAEEIARRTGRESRAVVVGLLQSSGRPSAADRTLATQFGMRAVDAIHDGDFGVMVAVRGTDVVTVPLAAAVTEPRRVPPARYREAEFVLG